MGDGERRGEKGWGKGEWGEGERTFTAVEAGLGGLRSVARFEAVGAVGGLAGARDRRGVSKWGGGRDGKRRTDWLGRILLLTSWW